MSTRTDEPRADNIIPFGRFGRTAGPGVGDERARAWLNGAPKRAYEASVAFRGVEGQADWDNPKERTTLLTDYWSAVARGVLDLPSEGL